VIALLVLWLSFASAGTLQVHVLDVGQGDSILIEAPGDKRILIDASTDGADVAERLQARGIEKLNLVVSTHPHADHIGGMASVLKNIEVGMYVDNGMTHNTLTYLRTPQSVEKREVPYRAALNGRVFNVGPEAKLTIIHPRSTLLRGTRSDLNSNSVILRLDHKNICFLFMGDAEDPTERDLLNRGLEPCAVLKVAHHGSSHSTSDSFLRAVKPKYAAISSGAGNRYGHPAPETLSRLEAADVEVHRTDLEGNITFISSGRSVSIRSQKTAPIIKATDVETAQDVEAVASAVPSGAPININDADATALQRFHGIGPSKSAAIVADRTANGPFGSCGELQRVKGIGPKTVEAMGTLCITEDSDDPPEEPKP
jgi:competence protein ComEC